MHSRSIQRSSNKLTNVTVYGESLGKASKTDRSTVAIVATVLSLVNEDKENRVESHEPASRT